MPTNFRHPKRKISLAREHIEALEKASSDFFAPKPYFHFVEPDRTGLKDVYKVRLTRELPDRIFNLVDQTVGALRAALDRSCYATCKLPHARNAYFPIASNASELERTIRGARCKDIEPEILSFISTPRPYKGGNDLIWSLNQLCNADKHKNIEPYGFSGVASEHQHLSWSEPKSVEVEWGSYWDSARQELVVITSDRGVDLQYGIKVMFLIAFKEVEWLSGRPAIPILREMAAEVERTVTAIEIEAIRLGLTP